MFAAQPEVADDRRARVGGVQIDDVAPRHVVGAKMSRVVRFLDLENGPLDVVGAG